MLAAVERAPRGGRDGARRRRAADRRRARRRLLHGADDHRGRRRSTPRSPAPSCSARSRTLHRVAGFEEALAAGERLAVRADRGDLDARASTARRSSSRASQPASRRSTAPTYGSRAAHAVRRRAAVRQRLARGRHRGARRLLRLEDRLHQPRSRARSEPTAAQRRRPDSRRAAGSRAGAGQERARARPGTRCSPTRSPRRARPACSTRSSSRPTPTRSPRSRDHYGAEVPVPAAGRARRPTRRRTSSGSSTRSATLDAGGPALRALRAAAADQPVPRRRRRSGAPRAAARARRRRRLAPRGRAVPRSTRARCGWCDGDDLMPPLLAQPGDGVPVALAPVPGAARGLRPELEPRDRLDARRSRAAATIAGERVVAVPDRRAEGFSIDYPTTGCWPSASSSRRGQLPGDRAAPMPAQPSPMTTCATSRRPSSTASATLDGDPAARAAAFADACRLNVLYMIAARRLGPHRHELQLARHRLPGSTSRCCGDERPLLLLQGPRRAGALRGADRRSGGSTSSRSTSCAASDGLPGHPDVAATPEVVTNTGSLGMGDLEGARGSCSPTAWPAAQGRVFVLTGDGELQEGQFWESLQPAANRGLRRDHRDRRPQQDPVGHLGRARSATSATSRRSCARSAGRSRAATATTSARSRRRSRGSRRDAERPEARDRRHDEGRRASRSWSRTSLPPRPTRRSTTTTSARRRRRSTSARSASCSARLNERLDAARRRRRSSSSGRADAAGAPAPPPSPQRLVAAYGEALVEQARARAARSSRSTPTCVKDTGLIAFRERFPERFFECGIAEQDMVSQAGAMALAGAAPGRPLLRLLPLDPAERADLQQRHRGDEGHLRRARSPGSSPAGPGHSHQSVRDISALGAVPGMALIEPCSRARVARGGRLGGEQRAGLRLHPPRQRRRGRSGFEPPAVEALVAGRGTVLRPGRDVALRRRRAGDAVAGVARGRAARGGRGRGRRRLAAVAARRRRRMAGGGCERRADRHASTTTTSPAARATRSSRRSPRMRPRPAGAALGVEEVPGCGENNEVLRAHRLDGDSVAERVRATPACPDRAHDARPLLGHRRDAADDGAGRRLRPRGGGPRGLRREPDFAALQTAGLTDHQIAVRRDRARAAAEPSLETVAAFLRSYERHLPDRLRWRQGRVLPGVLEILDDLDGARGRPSRCC